MLDTDVALDLCCYLKSFTEVAVTAGCKTTTSAVLVHCLRQKTEDELMEVTLKMVRDSLQAPTQPSSSLPSSDSKVPETGFFVNF